MSQTRSEEAHDRLTRLCAAMTETLDAHPESDDSVKCVVFLDDGDRGGLQMHGYEDDADAITDVLVHIRAIFRANGSDLQFLPLDQIGQG